MRESTRRSHSLSALSPTKTKPSTSGKAPARISATDSPSFRREARARYTFPS